VIKRNLREILAITDIESTELYRYLPFTLENRHIYNKPDASYVYFIEKTALSGNCQLKDSTYCII